MNLYRLIVLYFVSLVFSACSQRQNSLAPEAMQQAQTQYDSGYVCLQNDSLMEALPHFFEVAECLERLPEDMTDEEMLLTSRAYYQMAHVFRRKIENNAQIDALRRALYYQKMIPDTTWMIWTGRALATAFEVVKENDSARYYLDKVMPYIDSVSDVWEYIAARHLLSSLYYDSRQIDSCVMVQKQIIGYKARRGMDTKNDSVSIGMNLYFSSRLADAKPYLLKVLEADLGDVERGALMSLLVDIYQEENNADSAALFHTLCTDYVQAESEQVSDGMLAVKQYEQFKAERDARLQTLREQKETQTAQRKKLIVGCIAVLLVLALLAFMAYHRHYKRIAVEQSERISRDLQEARGTLEAKEMETLRLKAVAIYNDRLNNTGKRIIEVFNGAYPEALAQLKATYPDLNETELDICVFSFFGFRVKEMADILDLRENTVAKYRSHVKKKTQNEAIEGLIGPFLG